MQKKFYNWQYFSGQEILSSGMRKNSEPGQKEVGLARSRHNLHKGVVVEWMVENKIWVHTVIKSLSRQRWSGRELGRAEQHQQRRNGHSTERKKKRYQKI